MPRLFVDGLWSDPLGRLQSGRMSRAKLLLKMAATLHLKMAATLLIKMAATLHLTMADPLQIKMADPLHLGGFYRAAQDT